jgi:hypothetical protein
MHRFGRLLLALLTSGAAIGTIATNGLIAHTLFKGFPELALNQTRPKSALERLQSIFRPRRRPGGTRGPICLITPGLRPEWLSLSEIPFVLSDRPLFVWERSVAKVELRLASNRTTIWQQILPPQSQRTVYQGPALKPGQTYQVIAFGASQNPLNTGEDAQFTVVETTQRDEIIKDLAALEAKLKQENFSSEAIAIAKATELSKRSLLSDAYQLLDALPARSPELDAFLKKISDQVCGN